MHKNKRLSSSKSAVSSRSVEDLILDAYSRLQYQKGASQVVLQDLAKEVGVAFGTVRYHFNQAGRDVTQEALLYVTKRAYAYIDEELFKARSQENFNPVLAYIQVMFDWVHKFSAESSLIIYYYYLCTTEAEVAIPNQVFLEKARLRIEALIHEAVGRKIYSTPKDVSKAALQIHMTLTGACIIIMTQRSTSEFQMQVDLCKKIVDQILKD